MNFGLAGERTVVPEGFMHWKYTAPLRHVKNTVDGVLFIKFI